jgi:hypothetical protein
VGDAVACADLPPPPVAVLEVVPRSPRRDWFAPEHIGYLPNDHHVKVGRRRIGADVAPAA